MPYGTRPGGRVSTMAALPMYTRDGGERDKEYNFIGDYDLEQKWEHKALTKRGK